MEQMLRENRWMKKLASYVPQVLGALILIAIMLGTVSPFISAEQYIALMSDTIPKTTVTSEGYALAAKELGQRTGTAVATLQNQAFLAYHEYRVNRQEEVLERLNEIATEIKAEEAQSLSGGYVYTGTDGGGTPSGGRSHGSYVANVTIARLGIYDRAVYYGANYAGSSVYAITMGSTSQGWDFIGSGGTSLIGAHNGAAFKNLGAMQSGDIVTVTTSSGTYTYQVTGSTIVWNSTTDTAAWNSAVNGRAANTLILITCYPFNTWPVPNRYLVYCSYIG